MVNSKRLFYGSCFALITTAFSFSIWQEILVQFRESLGLTFQQLGYIKSNLFLGFTISMLIGGFVYNIFGPKKIMQFAFIVHILAIGITIFYGNYNGLLISTLLFGLGNGCTEAACNPMITDSYKGKEMDTMLNRFHVWFPGGIVLGFLLMLAMKGIAWQIQVSVMLIPTLTYFYLFFGQNFPDFKQKEGSSFENNFKAIFSPLFIFMFCCMAFTAISEFGPTNWINAILKGSGANPLLMLAIITGTMAVARFFAGAIIHKIDKTGVLIVSAILVTIGIFLLSKQTGYAAYISAFVYACGIAFFWPNMLGFVAEKIPKSGALGISVVGAVGMFSNFIFAPIVGNWQDKNVATASNGADYTALKAAAETKDLGALGMTMKDVESKITDIEFSAGQLTLAQMIIFPAILIVAFAILYFWQKGKKGTGVVSH